MNFDFLWEWMLNKAKDYLIRNWKTTLVGIVGALLVQFVKDEGTRQTLMAAIVALLGIAAKDGDQTGTITQPREPLPTQVVSPPQDGQTTEPSAG